MSRAEWKVDLPSGRWFGVQVKREWTQGDAYEIAVGQGHQGSGTWNVIGPPVYSFHRAVAIGFALYESLVPEAQEQDRRYVAQEA